MSSSLYNTLIYLDMFGKPVTLNVFGKKRHRTLLGAIVTICATVFFIFAFQKKLKEFFQNESINVNSKTLRDNLEQIQISPEKLMFAIRFDLNQENPDKKIPYSFKIQQVIQNKDIDGQGVNQKVSNSVIIPSETCTIYHFQQQLRSDINVIQSFFENVNIDQFVCPQINSRYTLQGNFNKASYQYLKQKYIFKQLIQKGIF